MDTTETGGFLELTEGLQVGGGRLALWVPSYAPPALLDIIKGPFNIFRTLVLGDTFPAALLRDTNSISLVLPTEEDGDFTLDVEGFLLPGQELYVDTNLGLFPATDEFTVTIRFSAELAVQFGPELDSITPWIGVTLNEEFQGFTAKGVVYTRGAGGLLLREPKIIGTYTPVADKQVVVEALTD
jgi:hypothetical protein